MLLPLLVDDLLAASVLLVPAFYSCSDVCDGSGRDLYLADRAPCTGFQPSAVPPRSDKARCALGSRPVVVPKYKPSGTGRDTFHQVDLSLPRPEFKLRDYEARGLGLRYGSEPVLGAAATSSQARPRQGSGSRGRVAARRSAHQKSSVARLSEPKRYNVPVDPIGSIRPGSWLRATTTAADEQHNHHSSSKEHRGSRRGSSSCKVVPGA